MNMQSPSVVMNGGAGKRVMRGKTGCYLSEGVKCFLSHSPFFVATITELRECLKGKKRVNGKHGSKGKAIENACLCRKKRDPSLKERNSCSCDRKE